MNSDMVLFVDDEPAVRELYARMARRMGYQAKTADDGLEALELASREFFPVIVTDLRMPGLDGWKLLERLRVQSPHSVTLVASGAPELDLPSFESDGSLLKVLAKPCTYQQLQSALEEAFGRAQEIDVGSPTETKERILLVEDDPVDAEIFLLRVQSLMPEMQIEHVTTLESAIAQLHDSNYQVVVSDLDLPDAKGTEAVGKLRSASPNSALVVLSGTENESMAVSALKLGAHDYLFKDRVDGETIRRATRYAVERRDSERRLQQLAQYDQLTGLANRSLFQDRLAHALARARRESGSVSVLFLDLDRFKPVNDTYGHAAGDELLKVIAGRLMETTRESDTVARLGGDEFAIVVESLDKSMVESLARRLISSIRKPCEIACGTVEIGASVGGACFPGDGYTVEGLLKAADKAMYLSKELGRGLFHWPGAVSDDSREKLKLEQRLREALDSGSFELYYQPQIHMQTGETRGMEALLRWPTPSGEVLTPAEFLPSLVDLGLMEKLGSWVLETACSEAMNWPRDWTLSVNVDVRELTSELPGRVAETLKSTGFPAYRLELEMTESHIVQDFESTSKILTQLRSLGVSLALDNFGSGASSLACLTRIPIQALKIDRSFLLQSSEALIRSLVGIGHALDMEVLIEGIETKEQCEVVLRSGCDSGQGYYIAGPGPASSLVLAPESYVA